MFHPNMHSTTEGFSVVGSLKYRAWNNVVADVWEVDSSVGAGGEYQSPYPRLFAVLQGSDSIAIGAEGRRMAPMPIGPLSFIPAGMKVWSHVPVASRLRHLDIHFDAAHLVERFGGEFDPTLLATPRIMFEDERLLVLARLLSEECSGPGLNDLYGEGLALSLFTALFQVQRAAARAGGLSQRRLRQATDFIEVNCLRNIRLQELAELVGLSQSYFSSAFKASTGVAPHQWQMRARIERVKTMLMAPEPVLSEIAMAAGFADQAHMTRTFKQHSGLTPAAWLRAMGT